MARDYDMQGHWKPPISKVHGNSISGGSGGDYSQLDTSASWVTYSDVSYQHSALDKHETPGAAPVKVPVKAPVKVPPAVHKKGEDYM